MTIETRFTVEGIVSKETDDRGRLYLGTDYADERVTVAILDNELVHELKEPEYCNQCGNELKVPHRFGFGAICDDCASPNSSVESKETPPLE